jgi:DNA-binding transcriptional LysR family regulator
LRHLRAFLAVAQAGSTAGAARQLNVSQPSVSVSIKELEMILGRPLFERLPARGLVPTSFGQRKIPEARALGAALAAFEQSGGGEEEPAGQVAFGYFSTLGPQYVPGILARMTRRYPKISVQPVEADLGELGRLLNAGRVELALSYDVEIGPGLAVERIAELDPYALLPVGHRLTRRRAVTPRELAGDPLVLVDLPLSGEFLLSVFAPRESSPESRIVRIRWRWSSAWWQMASASQSWSQSEQATARTTGSGSCAAPSLAAMYVRVSSWRDQSGRP